MKGNTSANCVLIYYGQNGYMRSTTLETVTLNPIFGSHMPLGSQLLLQYLVWLRFQGRDATSITTDRSCANNNSVSRLDRFVVIMLTFTLQAARLFD